MQNKKIRKKSNNIGSNGYTVIITVPETIIQ